MSRWGLSLSSLVLLAGCAAAKAQIGIVGAEQALARAREYDADELAQYEYQMASLYLEKAREEAGWSDFRIADALARQSAEWSDRAIIFVERHGRAQFNLDEISDTTAPAPAPAPEQSTDILEEDEP